MTFSATLVTAGTQNLTATDTTTSTITGTESNITVQPSTAQLLTVSGFPTTATAGVAYNFTVTARDIYGNVATGYTGTVAFSSSDPEALLPDNYTFTSSDAGKHTFSATLETAGIQWIAATDTGNSSINGQETNILVVTGHHRGHVGSDAIVASTTQVGTALNFTVTAYIPYSNVANGYFGTVQFPSSDTGAALPGHVHRFHRRRGNPSVFDHVRDRRDSDAAHAEFRPPVVPDQIGHWRALNKTFAPCRPALIKHFLGTPQASTVAKRREELGQRLVIISSGPGPGRSPRPQPQLASGPSFPDYQLKVTLHALFRDWMWQGWVVNLILFAPNPSPRCEQDRANHCLATTGKRRATLGLN